MTEETVETLRALIERFEWLAEVTGQEQWTQSAHVVEKFIDASNDCPYTMSHTRAICGRPQCRES
jgi:hypothetical protein